MVFEIEVSVHAGLVNEMNDLGRTGLGKLKYLFFSIQFGNFTGIRAQLHHLINRRHGDGTEYSGKVSPELAIVSVFGLWRPAKSK